MLAAAERGAAVVCRYRGACLIARLLTRRLAPLFLSLPSPAQPSYPGMACFMGFAAEASSVLPDSAYHARAARERADGDYAFTARAFPEMYDQAREVDLGALTQLDLNDRQAPSVEGAGKGGDGSASSSSSASVPSAKRPRDGGLELTLHEAHGGHLIGSVVWDGGKVLAWLLEGMHSRVRDLKEDGSGFVDTDVTSTASSANSFTSPALLEYLSAHSSGHAFDIPRDFLVGARVLELGAGTGVTGLACVKLGARSVAITDIADLKSLMRENVRRNCPGTLREEWIEEEDRAPAANATTVAPTTEPAVTVAATAAASPASPIADASSPPPTAASSVACPVDDLPLSALYLSCSNCDDLCEQAFECAACDAATLCEVCDQAFHRPASKAKHVRVAIGLGMTATTTSSSTSTAASTAASVSTAAVPASTPTLAPLPSRCDVYVEELLWGEATSALDLAPSLREPFDVIIMADVVYDAYSTRGVGSEGCDTFRKLFKTLCLLCAPDSETGRAPIVLMTYTPRRAPEKAFFDLLATEFVWAAFRAVDLLPVRAAADAIDERIWIYQLHRTPLARRLNEKQRVYMHQDAYGSEVALTREREQEEQRRRAAFLKTERVVRAPDSASAPAPAASSSSSASASAACSSSSAAPLPDLAPSPASSAPLPPPALNLTPTWARHMEAEEARQQSVLATKLAQRRAKNKQDQEQQLGAGCL